MPTRTLSAANLWTFLGFLLPVGALIDTSPVGDILLGTSATNFSPLLLLKHPMLLKYSSRIEEVRN